MHRTGVHLTVVESRQWFTQVGPPLGGTSRLKCFGDFIVLERHHKNGGGHMHTCREHTGLALQCIVQFQLGTRDIDGCKISGGGREHQTDRFQVQIVFLLTSWCQVEIEGSKRQVSRLAGLRRISHRRAKSFTGCVGYHHSRREIRCSIAVVT